MYVEGQLPLGSIVFVGAICIVIAAGLWCMQEWARRTAIALGLFAGIGVSIVIFMMPHYFARRPIADSLDSVTVVIFSLISVVTLIYYREYFVGNKKSPTE